MLQPLSQSRVTATNLDEFVSQGWSDHGNDAAGVFGRFRQGVELVSERAHLAPLAGLIVHVAGEHLGRWNDGIELLAQLEAHAQFDASTPEGKAVLRSKAILALAAGRRDEAAQLEERSRTGGVKPDASNRIRVLATAASALAGHGRAPAARGLLDEALTLAAYGPTKEDPASKALAITGNNLASALEERPNRTPDETALMVRAAETGLRFWSIAGGWMETERAHYRLSCSLRRASDLSAAFEHAKRCLAIVDANGKDPGESFYGHEALALAHDVAGDKKAARRERDAASSFLPGITDTEFLSMATDSLAALDRRLGPPTP